MPTSVVQSLKLTLVSALGLSKDALHIHVGLGVFVAACMVFRRSPGSWLPWGLAVVAAFAGEVVDLRDDLASLGHWRWAASLHDVVNTVVWPTVFFVVARFTQVFQK